MDSDPAKRPGTNARHATAIGIALGIWLAAASGLAPAAAGALISPTQRQRLSPLLNRAPMAFYVAKGPVDACGPGCREWIVADGKFDPGTARRFKDFLGPESRRRLPVFFHSQGGALREATGIALTLREYGMTAGIARTIPTGCGINPRRGKSCRDLIAAGGEVPARLHYDGAQCHSACVYAFAGAAQRSIGGGAMMGVHASKFNAQQWKLHVKNNPNAKRESDALYRRNLQVFVLRMGVDPQLVDFAEGISFKSLYLLDRKEIARFGLESGSSFETRWLVKPDAAGQLHAHKAVSIADAGPQHNPTAFVQLSCVNSFGHRLTFYRQLPKDEQDQPTVARFAAGDKSISLVGHYMRSELMSWGTFAQFDILGRIANEARIDVTVTFVRGTRPPRIVSFSTSGLAAALSELQRICDPGGPAKVSDGHARR